MKCPHCGKEVELASTVKLKKPKEVKTKEKGKKLTKVVKTSFTKRAGEKKGKG